MTIQERAAASGLDGLSAKLLGMAFALSVIHLTDHALRVDHSGWPFRPEVTPYTYSLLAIPMVLFALFGPRRLFWLRWTLLLFGTLATLYAHIFIETPHMQFAMWAHDRSSDPHQQGFHNIPDIRSPALGAASAIVAMILNVVAVTSTITMLVRGVRTRG